MQNVVDKPAFKIVEIEREYLTTIQAIKARAEAEKWAAAALNKMLDLSKKKYQAKDRLVSAERCERQAAAKIAATEKKAIRKADTRRKILIGACLMSIAAKDQEVATLLSGYLDVYLTGAKDRDLFGLPPLKSSQPATQENHPAPTTVSATEQRDPEGHPGQKSTNGNTVEIDLDNIPGNTSNNRW